MRGSWWQRVLVFPFQLFVLGPSFFREHSETIMLRGWQVWDVIKGLGELTEAVLQVLGRIAVNLFLAVGLFVLFCQVSAELGYQQPQLKPYFELVLRIFDGKVIWVVPLIFGATLGILHLWKLQLDRRRYWEEQRECWRKVEEEQVQRRKATVSMQMPMNIPRSRRQDNSD